MTVGHNQGQAGRHFAEFDTNLLEFFAAAPGQRPFQLAADPVASHQVLCHKAAGKAGRTHQDDIVFSLAHAVPIC